MRPDFDHSNDQHDWRETELPRPVRIVAFFGSILVILGTIVLILAQLFP
jgi:hypothetical protein